MSQDNVGPPCDRCQSSGVYFNRQIEAGRYGHLELCICIEALCRCGGRKPYQYWDEDSQSLWCPCRPARMRMNWVNKLFKEADIAERYRWKFSDDFTAQAPDGTPVQAAGQVAVYLSSLVDFDEEPERGFLLHGPPGTGKTLLGCIMLNELMLRRGRRARFLNLSRTFFQRLKDTFSENSSDYGRTWPIFDELARMPYLMLDDFGTQRGTDWEKEMLYDLVDARYGEQRFTIITTNQTLDEVKQDSGGRVFSRLMEMCHTVSMEGIDYRQHLQARR
ncbi:MAG: AAA family ATPase [Candidatus Latescibacteria bacterium]|nr:AAA family ATPase [Candidatus Latescibacterota bacterium]